MEGSSYARTSLKRRLYAEGLKERRCELCGQDELWQGRRMALILDHVNGVPDDNRLENLQIVCPNCAATLDTHAGKKLRQCTVRPCPGCGEAFMPDRKTQKFCGPTCVARAAAKPRTRTRRVARPPLVQIIAEVEAEGWSAVGRRYGVSDNAVRKWVRNGRRAEVYAAQEAATADAPPPP